MNGTGVLHLRGENHLDLKPLAEKELALVARDRGLTLDAARRWCERVGFFAIVAGSPHARRTATRILRGGRS